MLVLYDPGGLPEERGQGNHCGEEFLWGWWWAGGAVPEAIRQTLKSRGLRPEGFEQFCNPSHRALERWSLSALRAKVWVAETRSARLALPLADLAGGVRIRTSGGMSGDPLSRLGVGWVDHRDGTEVIGQAGYLLGPSRSKPS